jgi:voltage-gated potassium channel
VDARAREVERRLEWPLLIAALLVVPALAIEFSEAGEPWDTVASVLNWGTWLAFVAEMAIMLRVAPDRRRWLREHPLDVAIVFLTPPFLPASLQAARAFRLLRLLRLVRAFTLTRRMLSTEGVRDAAVLALLTVLGGGAAFVAVERGAQQLSAWDGVWWALTTVTTVGYGDVAPRTTGGRVVAVVVMVVGIGFVALLTAAAAERFVRNREEAERDRVEVLDRLDDLARRLDAISAGAAGSRSGGR